MNFTKDEYIIPKFLFIDLEYARNNPNKVDSHDIMIEILKNQMFQMLNDLSDLPLPEEYCLHVRQIVSPDSTTSTGYKPYQCINCKKYL